MMFLTGLYRSANDARNGEIYRCLEKNLANPSFTKIHLFFEDNFKPESQMDALIKSAKNVVCVSIPDRMTYKRYFEYVNAHAEKGEMAVVANADIYFDDTIRLANKRAFFNFFIAISRWQPQPDGTWQLYRKAKVSQDSWIFMAPVQIPFYCDFSTGWPGCDSRIAWEMAQLHYRLCNPPWDIKTYHLHESGIRNKVPHVPRPHLHITPGRLPL